MSTPTTPPPSFEFHITCFCLTCGRQVASSTSTTEQDAKDAFMKAVTASELHDCKPAPK
jgi:hypothetical protein